MSKARLETGVIQCGDDWPGVFVRGDFAAALVLAIDNVLADLPPGDTVTQIERGPLLWLQQLLAQARVGSGHIVHQRVEVIE